MSEYILSDKRVGLNGKHGWKAIYFEQNIKEFIKELKEGFDELFNNGNNQLGEYYNLIDKLAGDNLK